MPSFKLHLADGRTIKSEKTLVMGILNATPDSFSDGGELANKRAVRKRVWQMLKDGADMLDVGGESTRPGHKKVSADEEIKRVIPVIKTIRKISKAIPISVDTQKASVAEAALQAGGSLINDVSALSDKEMAAVVKKYDCSIILMRGEPTGKDTVKGCRKQFEKIINNAKAKGLHNSRILLDPGLGFGDLKSGDYSVSPGSDPVANILLILRIKDYSLELPVVIGASRKRFIGDISGVEKADQRLAGSLAAAVMAKESGASIIRVHDVAETIKAFNNLGSV